MKINNKTIATALVASMATCAWAVAPNGLKVYINPGHGGHDSDDRNVVIAPYAQGDPNGYWESNSNLSKGLQLRDMLLAKGYDVEMSRVTNTTADDLPLSTIVALSNKSNSNVFFSIHSNATGTVARRNFPLMLYRGYTADPVIPEAKRLCQVLNKHLLSNQSTVWTSSAENCTGDWTFYPSWGTSGLGVLRGNNVTSMLSEGSFHDYIPEAYRLMSDDFCWLEAWHFRKATDEFFGQPGLSVGVVAGRLNDTRMLRDGDFIKYGDDKLATINNAKVELLDADGNTVQTYTTHNVNINGFYLFKEVQPGKYRVRVTEEGHYPVTGEELTVVADQVSYCNLKLAKVRNTAPEVLSYTPVWNDGDEPVLCNTPIVFQFNWDMDTELTEKAFTISPEVAGEFIWEDLNYRMVFKPTQPYQTNTVYTVTLGTGATHAGGMTMAQPVSFKFATTDRNFLDILGSYPKEGDEVHYKGASVEFRLDKLPLLNKLTSQLTCTDSQGNKVNFNTRAKTNSKVGDPYGYFRIPFSGTLTVGETYTLNLDGSFSDKDGLTIQAPISLKFKAVDASEHKDEKADVAALDDPDKFSYDPEQSANVEAASVSAMTSNPLFDDKATSFTYKFNADEASEVRYSYTESGEAASIEPGEILGVHIHGDLTNNSVYLELTSDVSTLYVPVCNMDFLGWRYIEVPATVEGNSHLTGIKVVQTPSQMSHAGTFSLDRLVKNAGAGVDDIEIAELTVYPNPASEYLVANAASLITRIELVALNGSRVAEAQGNVLNVSNISDGAYIALIYTANGRAARHVNIKH